MEIGAEAARKKLPELLERAHGGETSIIKKRGVPYAALVPLDQLIDPGMSDGLLSLLGTGRGLWGGDVSTTIHGYRDEWE
ncbi:MAG: Prevent-host-death protein [Sedimenticola sp.]